MPSGVGADTLQNIPTQPYVINPAQFFALTEKNEGTLKSRTHPGAGSFFTEQLAQTGIISKLRLMFVGTVTVATAAATTSNRWPYGLVENFKLSANGQNDLFNVDGLDLHALRFIRYPAFTNVADDFTGTVGGGDSVAVGATNIALSWEIPIAMEDTGLVAALFAQSSATNLTVRVETAANTRLFSANPGNVTITGTWYIQQTWFEIPFDAEGKLVLPDVSRLHGVVANEYPFSNTGDVRTSLIRAEGQLARLFSSVVIGSNSRATADPVAATSRRIDKIRLEYGGNQRPRDYDPAWSLLAANNEHYGATAPYDRHVIDLVRENPARDAIHMQGVTELAVVHAINSAASPSGASVRLVQEQLF